LPSPEGEGVSRKADGWGVSTLGGTAANGGRGDCSQKLSLASPFGRGVLRKQDGEGCSPTGNNRPMATGRQLKTTPYSSSILPNIILPAFVCKEVVIVTTAVFPT